MRQAKKLIGCLQGSGRQDRSLAACNQVARARRWPRPPARWPAREGAAGMPDWR